MNDFILGLSFALSIVALCYAVAGYRASKKAFTIIENKETRTVVVNTDNGNITVIKEQKNVPIADIQH